MLVFPVFPVRAQCGERQLVWGRIGSLLVSPGGSFGRTLTPSQPAQPRKLRQHLCTGASCARGGVCRRWRRASCGIRASRKRLHTQELTCPQSSIFRAGRAADGVSIIDLLAAGEAAGEGIAPTKSGRQRRHHDVAGYRADDEWRRDNEPLRH